MMNSSSSEIHKNSKSVADESVEDFDGYLAWAIAFENDDSYMVTCESHGYCDDDHQIQRITTSVPHTYQEWALLTPNGFEHLSDLKEKLEQDYKNCNVPAQVNFLHITPIDFNKYNTYTHRTLLCVHFLFS